MRIRSFFTVLALFAVSLVSIGCASKTKESGESAQTSQVAVAVAIGSEKAIDSPAGVFDGPGNGAEAASDGTNHFVVWFDSRGALPSITGARVSAAGTVIDPTGIELYRFPGRDPNALLGTGESVPSFLRVTFGGGVYLVSWVAGDGSTGTLLGIRVGVDGHVIDSTPFTIASDWYNRSLSILADDTGFGVIYERYLPAIGGLERVFRHLSVSTPVPLSVEHAIPQPASDVAYAFGAGEYMALTNEFVVGDGGSAGTQELRMTRFKSDGTLIDSTPKAIASTPIAGSGAAQIFVAFTGTNFVALQQGTPWISRSVTPAGVAGPAVALSNVSSAYGVASAFDGAVLWGTRKPDGLSVLQRLDANGGLVGSAVPSSGKGTEFRPSFAPSAMLVPLSDASVNVVASDLSVATTRALSRFANAQSSPAIAFDGIKYLSVWIDDRGARTDSTSADGGATLIPGIYAARVNEDGSSETPFLLASSASIRTCQLIFDGTKFFATWLDGATLKGVSIAKSGDTLPGGSVVGSTIDIATGIDTPSLGVASDSNNRLIAFQIVSNDAKVQTIRVAIADDKVLDAAPVTLAANVSFQQATPVSVAFDGSRFLVVWSGGGGILFKQLYGTFVKSGQGVSDGVPFPIYEGVGPQFAPAVASDGKNGFLVSWLNEQGVGSIDVLATRVGSDGSVGKVSQTLKVSARPAASAAPAIVYANDRANYLIAWGDAAGDILGSWVPAQADRILDPGGVALSADKSTNEVAPSLAVGTSRRLGLAYVRFNASAGVGAPRAQVRILTSDKESGSSCSANAECATRFCVDGVCCATACDDQCSTCSATPGTCTPTSSATACKISKLLLCDGTGFSCRTSCARSADCVPGYECVTGACISPEQVCLDDFRVGSSVEKDLPEAGTTCANDLKCRGNACLSKCATVDDCRAGLLCDFAGACVSPPNLDNTEGCAVSGAGGSWASWLPVLGVAAMMWRRRRPARRLEGSIQ